MAELISSYQNGTLFRTWDDATATFTEYDEDGEIVLTRPYMDEENAGREARQAQEVEEEAEQSLRDQTNVHIQELRTLIGPGDSAPDSTTINGIINTANSDINQNAARYIVALARVLRAITRAQIAVAKLVARNFTEDGVA